MRFFINLLAIFYLSINYSFSQTYSEEFLDGTIMFQLKESVLSFEKINQLDDGWTILTSDNLPSAHFEHNIAIIDGKPNLLSTFDFIYESLGIKSDEEKKFK